MVISTFTSFILGKLLSPVEMYKEELSYSAQTISKIHVFLVSKLLKVRPEINLKTVIEQREERTKKQKKKHFPFSCTVKLFSPAVLSVMSVGTEHTSWYNTASEIFIGGGKVCSHCSSGTEI